VASTASARRPCPRRQCNAGCVASDSGGMPRGTCSSHVMYLLREAWFFAVPWVQELYGSARTLRHFVNSRGMSVVPTTDMLSTNPNLGGAGSLCVVLFSNLEG
jgi:hypothetical protein